MLLLCTIVTTRAREMGYRHCRICAPVRKNACLQKLAEDAAQGQAAKQSQPATWAVTAVLQMSMSSRQGWRVSPVRRGKGRCSATCRQRPARASEHREARAESRGLTRGKAWNGLVQGAAPPAPSSPSPAAHSPLTRQPAPGAPRATRTVDAALARRRARATPPSATMSAAASTSACASPRPLSSSTRLKTCV